MDLIIINLSQHPRCLLYEKSRQLFIAPKKNSSETVPVPSLEEQCTEILNEAKLPKESLSKIYTFLGPGSFTSLRSGMSFALGFAKALDKPLWGIPTHCIEDHDFYISLRPRLTETKTRNECVAEKIEFMHIFPDKTLVEVPKDEALALGTKETREWPTEAQLLRALSKEAEHTQSGKLNYGVEPKISGKRQA